MPLPLTGSAAVENDEEVLEWTGAPLTPLNCVAGAAIMLDGLGYFVGERIDTSHVRLTRAYAGATDTVAAEITQLSPEQVATATLNKRAAEVMSQLSVLDANGRGLFYNLIGVTGDNDPGPGNIALDAAGAGVSEIYIDVLDANEGGRDVSGIIGLWEAGTVLVLRSLATNAYLAAVLTEAPAGSGGYRRLAVEVIGSDGELAAEPLAVEWVLKGERGEAYATDATVADMAGLTDYDAEDDGFRAFVRDLGAGYDNRSGVVVKAGEDWDITALYTGPRGYPSIVPGPVGPPGIVWLGAWDDETVFALNDGVENNGSSWRSLQDDNLNHPPPALPATSNAWWQLLAAKGVDGTGTGDVVGPAGAVNGRIAVFDGTTGKLLKDGGVTVDELVPADGSITNAKLADMAQATFKGRAVGAGVPEDLTASQVLTLLKTVGAYARDNVVGTVSQASGVPTGGLIESGSNANGEYTKFASGLMICTRSATMTYAGVSVLTYVWTFPSAFSSPPVVTHNPSSLPSAGHRESTAYTTSAGSNTSRTLAFIDNAGTYVSGDSLSTDAIAIGRWF